MSIICGIQKRNDKFRISIYNSKIEEEFEYSRSKDRVIQEIVDELIKKYENDIGKIVIDGNTLKSGEFENLKEKFKEHSNLFHIATEEELDFEDYLELKVQYSVGDFIIFFHHWNYTLFQCAKVIEGRVIWRQLDEKQHVYRKQINFEYIEKLFHVKMNQVHAVFLDDQEEINSVYGSELDKYNFQTINFIEEVNEWMNKSFILARNLSYDRKFPHLVRIVSYYAESPRSFVIQDWDFIRVPNSIKEYELRTDMIKSNSEPTSSTLTVAKNGEVQIVPSDNSSENLSVQSSVIFRTKLLFSHETKTSTELVWHLQFNINEEYQSHITSITSETLKEVLLSEINKLFSERLIELGSQYEDKFKDGQIVKKVIITVPQYFWFNKPHPLISNAIEITKSVNIEVIEIIEETHAGLLYYLSNEKYLDIIELGKRIAIFNIRETTSSCRVYEISEYDNKKYATCVGEVFQFIGEENKLSERDIDNIIVKKLEESIPDYLRNDVKLKIWGAVKKIKHELSSNGKTE